MATGISRIELKAWAATVGSLAAGLVLAVLEALADNPAMLEALPAWARFLIIACTPALVTFLAAYAAPHTRRPDLATPKHTGM